MEDSSAFISITAASVSLLSNLCLKDVLYFLTDISVSNGIMTEYMNNLLDEHSYFLKCFWLGICFLLFTQEWKWLFIHPCRSKTMIFFCWTLHIYIYVSVLFFSLNNASRRSPMLFIYQHCSNILCSTEKKKA